TFGLLCVIWGCSRARSSAVPFAVAAYITAAYWFTASTSFANPAVTIARSLSDTFAGIRPADVVWFVAAQLAGAIAATLLFRWLVPGLRADRVVVGCEGFGRTGWWRIPVALLHRDASFARRSSDPGSWNRTLFVCRRCLDWENSADFCTE